MYDGFISRFLSGEYLGLSLVDDLRCHHIAFSMEEVDLQVWVEEGSQPLLRKLLFTFKNLPMQPQYSARIMLWELDLMFIPEFFEAAISDEAEQVPVMRLDAAGVEIRSKSDGESDRP